MATVNVYEQYFEADLTASGVLRKAALVMLIAESGGGQIRYEAAVTFFPHRDEEDYAVSYDAYYSKVLFEGPGRRSKQKEAAFERDLHSVIDGLARDAGGSVFWDRPLRTARLDGGVKRKLITAVKELTPAQRDRIREAAAAAGLTALFFESPAEALPEASDAEVIFADSTELAGAAPRLRWFCTPFAGVEPYTAPGVFASSHAVLTNSSGAYGTAIAEHILEVSLAMLRQAPAYSEIIRKKEWIRTLPIRSIRDSRIVLLGTGDIGRETAERLKAFHPASITGMNRSGKDPGGSFDRVLPINQLDSLLPEADLLILSLPNTAETRHLLSRDRLALLPDGALIVNVGRGSVIDQTALEEQLRAGRLMAALDVFEEEPIPAFSSLWDCPGLYITPHIAGNLKLPYTVEKVTQLFLENLALYAQGSPLLRQIDLKKGY